MHMGGLKRLSVSIVSAKGGGGPGRRMRATVPVVLRACLHGRPAWPAYLEDGADDVAPAGVHLGGHRLPRLFWFWRFQSLAERGGFRWWRWVWPIYPSSSTGIYANESFKKEIQQQYYTCIYYT